MKTSELLERALILIKDENNWTRGELARDKENVPVPPESVYACKFCSLGALLFVAGGRTDDFLMARDALSFTIENKTDRWYSDVAEFNDIFDHKEVISVWRETIRRKKENGN